MKKYKAKRESDEKARRKMNDAKRKSQKKVMEKAHRKGKHKTRKKPWKISHKLLKESLARKPGESLKRESKRKSRNPERKCK